MALQTGENEQGLKKMIDMIRVSSICVLLIHFYYSCYTAFKAWELTSQITDKMLVMLGHTGLLNTFITAKLASLGLLLLSLLGVRGKKSEKANHKMTFTCFMVGLALYFGSPVAFYIDRESADVIAILYITMTGSGFVLLLTTGSLLTRIIKNQLKPDVFNKANETFPQEERFLGNEYSINLPAQYNLKGKLRKSWVNIVNPMRGLLVMGSPGSGKSYFVVEHVIRQHIEKGFSMLVYDYKFDDLSRLAYNYYLKHRQNYVVAPTFHVINLDKIFSRCNPLDPANMHDITDAVEAAKVILYGLNRSWLKKQGDFFVESPINFLTAIIWFLRKYEDGEYCTLPHAIELMQVEIAQLFSVLQNEPEIETYINPFISAFKSKSMEQLEGQLDAAKIAVARLSSPKMYYVLSGNDFSLDINNPEAPKILCIANNPQKQDVYGPVLSLYITRITKIINRKNRLKSSLVIDEFTTLTFLGFDTLIATGRSNKITTTLAIQDASQLKLNYGKDLADVVVNICGNIIIGQVGGEMAKQVSERLGKTLQDRESLSINSGDTSISRSKQLELAVPVSTISSLSAGEFVGMVADNPDQKINLKTFHANIINDHQKLTKEKEKFVVIPNPSKATEKEIDAVYLIIKQDIKDIVDSLMNEMMNDDGRKGLIL